MTEINEFVDQNDIYVDIGQELTRGKYCLAQYTNFDQRWYRGQILEVEANQFKVFFADYGDSDIVPKDKVRELPVDKFYELPLQAIECKLYGIKPIWKRLPCGFSMHIEVMYDRLPVKVDTEMASDYNCLLTINTSILDEEWSETVGNVLWDLTHYVNFDLRVLNAVVKGKEPARYAGRNKFVIELGTVSRSCDLNIAQELSWQQLAVLDEGSEMEPLFPKPSRLRMKMYGSLLEKIPDLCCSLYWETNEELAKKTCKEICGIVSSSLNRLKTYFMLKENLQVLFELLTSTESELVC
ncbi:uncharacterized protein LOC132747827 [Ruditapes philippinarum]|uniref:uncharacterized protein LOC132747827 n=1 Tax=Ruditapes philippinarum TaxID=129788 RepID=UPI00295B77B8|nr:uncharacterized protein LOC132747827 [Ruditapes philippinarum]